MEIPARAAASGQSTTPVITTTGTGPCTSCMYQALRASHFPSVPCLILRNSRMNSISVLVSRSCDGIFHTYVVWCNTFWFRALQNLQGPPPSPRLIESCYYSQLICDWCRSHLCTKAMSDCKLAIDRGFAINLDQSQLCIRQSPGV